MAKNQVPVTLENIDTLLNKSLDQKFKHLDQNLNKRMNVRFDRFEKHFDGKMNETKEELRSEFKHLPTKEQYYSREDKTMGELKKIREELETTNDLYEKTNIRVNKIDQHLGIDTSVVF